jgi:hypothetical protein
MPPGTAMRRRGIVRAATAASKPRAPAPKAREAPGKLPERTAGKRKSRTAYGGPHGGVE